MMRLKHILLLTTIALAFTANAQNKAETDTVVIITKAKDVTVTTGSGAISVEVGRTSKGNTYKYSATSVDNDSTKSNWDINLPFLNRKHTRVETTVLPRISMGWGKTFDQVGDFSAKTFAESSLEAAQISWWPWWNTSLSLGIGGQWVQFGFDGDKILTSHAGALTFIDSPEGAGSLKSTINSYSFIVPLRLYQRIYQDFGFSLSAIANFNTYATAKSSYMLGNNKYDITFKGLHQKTLTLEYSASLILDFFEVYAKYSPDKLFKQGYGPEFKRYSFGIAITF